MRYVCLIAIVLLVIMFLVLMAPLLSAQEGAAIYKERCAGCHDAPAGRVPSFSAIKAMSGDAVYLSLTSGSMRSRAEGLSMPQLFALLAHIAPTGGAAPASATSITPTCKSDAAFRPSADAARWNGWSTSVTNSRFQDARAAGLSASSVPQLQLKWAFNLGAVTMARSQPAVVGGRLFLATMVGTLYSLDAATGCTYWGFTAPGLRGGVVIGDVAGKSAAFFNDGGGTAYAVDAQSGALIWKTKPVDHFATIATATPQLYKGVLYLSYSSFEEALGGDPNYECCTFRGSVVALAAATGEKLWQTFTIPDEPKPTGKNAAGKPSYGPSGAAVWSTPTIDEELGVLYVATGDNYSDPPSATSDAILAMDLKTGKVRWSKQFTESDAFNNGCVTPQRANCPKSTGPDFDFGQPPILVRLGDGRRALVIAQKSGMVHAVDPDHGGKILWQTRASSGGVFGGSQWGSASDGQKVYVAISDVAVGGVADPKSPQGYRLTLDPKKGGGLYALDLATGKVAWSTKAKPCSEDRTDCSPAQSAAVTVVPGAVFAGSLDGHLRAYSTTTGEILWDTDTAREFATVNGKPARGGSLDAAGPAVVNGIVIVNSGYGQWGGMPGNVLLVFSVNGK